jgi:hypothetical protein
MFGRRKSSNNPSQQQGPQQQQQKLYHQYPLVPSSSGSSSKSSNDNDSPRPTTTTSCFFTFAEVFAGIGGFRLGLEPLGGKCVLASEMNPFAAKTYRDNFTAAPADTEHQGGGGGDSDGGGGGGGDGGDVVLGDITEYGAEMLPDFDLLTAGFPCQVIGRHRFRGCGRGRRGGGRARAVVVVAAF